MEKFKKILLLFILPIVIGWLLSLLFFLKYTLLAHIDTVNNETNKRIIDYKDKYNAIVKEKELIVSEIAEKFKKSLLEISIIEDNEIDNPNLTMKVYDYYKEYKKFYAGIENEAKWVLWNDDYVKKLEEIQSKLVKTELTLANWETYTFNGVLKWFDCEQYWIKTCIVNNSTIQSKYANTILVNNVDFNKEYTKEEIFKILDNEKDFFTK